MISEVESPTPHISSAVLDQFIQAGLPQSDALAVQRHLEKCPDCECRKEILEFWADMARSSLERLG